MTWRGLDIRWVVPRSEEGTTAGRRLSGRRWLRGALGAGGFDDVLLADAPADSGPGDGL
jgi:hypothetical protein